MSAQKDLAELIQLANETPCLGSLQASNFIRDHGPAIAELIEAVGAWRAVTHIQSAVEVGDRLKAAHSKLTEPK